eukprot:1122680-Alexandrium_andersonii.AAC.1
MAEVVRAVAGIAVAGAGDDPPGSVVPPAPEPTRTRTEIAKLQAELAASKASATAAVASAARSEAARQETAQSLNRPTVEAAEQSKRRKIREEQLQTGQQNLSGAQMRIDELEGALASSQARIAMYEQQMKAAEE